MSTITKSNRIPKPVLQEFVNGYSQIIDNIGGIIKETGYRTNYVAKKLRIPVSTFYLKKRTKTFTLDEVSQIIGMLDDDEQLENEYLLELAKFQMIDDEDDETITGDELISMLRK